MDARNGRQQRAVEHIDGEDAKSNIGMSQAIIVRKHCGAADIVSSVQSLPGNLGDGRSVAESKIQALRADRRKDVRRFADECDPVGAER